MIEKLGINITEKERKMLAELFNEEELEDNRIIAGCDEAGRGPLAGPVVAACCVLPPDFPFEILNDSKKMGESERKSAEYLIKEKAIAYSVTAVSNEIIDEINILNASLMAMRLSYLKVRRKVKVDLLLVDGNKCPDVDIMVKAVVKGDAKVPEIMAASILAKNERDRIMELADRLFPGYGYAKHKGYPTKEHVAMIKKYGSNIITRTSFHLKGEEITPLLL